MNKKLLLITSIIFIVLLSSCRTNKNSELNISSEIKCIEYEFKNEIKSNNLYLSEEKIDDLNVKIRIFEKDTNLEVISFNTYKYRNYDEKLFNEYLAKGYIKFFEKDNQTGNSKSSILVMDFINQKCKYYIANSHCDYFLDDDENFLLCTFVKNSIYSADLINVNENYLIKSMEFFEFNDFFQIIDSSFNDNCFDIFYENDTSQYANIIIPVSNETPFIIKSIFIAGDFYYSNDNKHCLIQHLYTEKYAFNLINHNPYEKKEVIFKEFNTSDYILKDIIFNENNFEVLLRNEKNNYRIIVNYNNTSEYIIESK